MKYLVSALSLSIAFIVGVALSSCGDGGGGGGGKKDGGGGGGVCPNNPSFCQGICCGTACVNQKTDPDNCGECGNQCKPGQGCTNGTCGCGTAGATCKTTDACCTTGCSNLDNDARNCGACDNQCPDNQICVSGSCVCGTATVNEVCTSGQMCCVDPGGNSSTCLASCSGGGGADGGTGAACVCSTPCLLGCAGTECCLENLLLMVCVPPDDGCMPTTGF